jgi:hypothetical protein
MCKQVNDVRETNGNAPWLAERQRLVRSTGPAREEPPAYTVARPHWSFAIKSHMTLTSHLSQMWRFQFHFDFQSMHCVRCLNYFSHSQCQ